MTFRSTLKERLEARTTVVVSQIFLLQLSRKRLPAV